MSSPLTTLTIETAAIVRNWQTLQGMSKTATCAAVVKADCYGLGMAAIAPKLWEAGCRYFFVAQLSEGVLLRQLLPTAHIAVLGGISGGQEKDFADNGLMPVLNALWQVRLWAAATTRFDRPLPAILHLDTGMNRLGFEFGEWQSLCGDNKHLLDGLQITAVMSHLVSSEEHENPLNIQQKQRLDDGFFMLQNGFPSRTFLRSFSNSSGVFLGAGYHYDLLRPGVALYGGNPAPHLPKSPMEAVVGLTAPLLQIRSVSAGETCGYNATWTAERPSRLGVANIGYADGLHRAFGRGGHRAGRVRYRIQDRTYIVPIAGRISMDLLTVDLTDVPDNDISLDASIVLLDSEYTIEDMAAATGTIGYEVLTHLGKRYDRVYI